MEELPTPLSRVELYLAKACGMDVTVPTPESRLELFLAKIAGEEVETPAPHSLTELWLTWVAGSEPIEPLAIEGAHIIGNQKVDTRYFAVACGVPGATLPARPQNRKEMYWAYIAINPPSPGVLKYATGTSIHLTDVVSGIEELQFVYGDTYQQTYSGKNLLPILDGTISNNGLTITVQDGEMTIDGTTTTGTMTKLSNGFISINGGAIDSQWLSETTPISNLNGKTISIKYISGTAPSSAWAFRVFTNTSAYNNQWRTGTSDTQYTWSSDTDPVSCFTLYVNGGYTFTNYKVKIQIETGSSATAYEPYTGGIPAPNPDYPQEIHTATGAQTVTISDGVTSQSYPISLTGKNLFDKNNPNIIEGYIDDYHSTITYDSRNRTVWIECEPNTTYTVSKIASPNSRMIGYTEAKPALNVQVYGLVNIYANTTTGTITTGATAKYLVVRLWSSSQDTSTTLDQMLASVQIEQGSQATPYAPYYNYELCKIDTYQDYIYKSGDDWYVHKTLKKITFSGASSETWAYNSSSAYPFRYNLADADQLAESQAYAPNVAVNYYTPFAWNISTRPDYGVTAATVDRNLCFRNVDITSLDAWKAWLDSHNTITYYPLATATDTKITDATLISQLEALNSAKLPKPIANITVSATDTNLPAPIKISYYGKSA